MIPSKRNTCLVSIQEMQTTADPQWGDQVSWVEERKAWVSIDPNRGREVFNSGETEAVVTHTIRGDFLALKGVEEAMRIVYHETHVYDPVPDSAEVYNILAVMPDKDNRADCMIQATLDNLRYGDLPSDIPQ